MKIVHIAPGDGGNAVMIAGYRLHTQLLRLGHESRMFVAHRRRREPEIVQFHPSGQTLSRLRRWITARRMAATRARNPKMRVPGQEFFSDDRAVHGADAVAQIPRADVVTVHAMFDFMDFATFFTTAPRRQPVVFIMHDLNLFTGGCHVPIGCTRYTGQCGACPRLESRVEHDLSREIWRRKRAALRAVPPGRLHLVAPSRWLAAEARRSALAGHLPITIIPSGVDTEIFRSRDRGCARALLSLPAEAQIVLFIAEPIYRVNKGYGVLVEALNGIAPRRDLLLLSAGSGKPPAEPRVPSMHLGYIGDERLLSVVYSAADLIVLPSAAENFPLTALEALGCGTPVVGFDVGGIPDIVRPGETGVLVPPGDVKGLGAAIASLLRDPDRRQRMGAACRRVAVEEYSLEGQARRHVRLYQAMLGGERNGDG